MQRTIHLLLGAAALAQPWAVLAAAPDAPAAPEASADAADAAAVIGYADIVVTAQKRETRLQETPASISAISAPSLENAAI